MKQWFSIWRNNRRYGFGLLSAWRETWRDWRGIKRMIREVTDGRFGTITEADIRPYK